jgi:hypothetical protein
MCFCCRTLLTIQHTCTLQAGGQLLVLGGGINAFSFGTAFGAPHRLTLPFKCAALPAEGDQL